MVPNVSTLTEAELNTKRWLMWKCCLLCIVSHHLQTKSKKVSLNDRILTWLRQYQEERSMERDLRKKHKG